MSDPNGPSSPDDFPPGGQTPPPPPPPPGSVPPPPGSAPPPPGSVPPSQGSVPPPPGSVPPPPGGGHAPPPPGGGFVNQPQQPGYQQSAGGSGVADAFQYGWTKFQQNIGNLVIAVLVWIGVFIVALLLSWLITSLVGGFGTTTDTIYGEIPSGASWWAQLIAWAVLMLLMIAANFIGGLALIRVGLLTTKGEAITPQNLFSTENLVPYVLTSLLVAVIVFVGSLFCFIPGYIAAFFLFFAPYYALDKGISPLEALSASVTIVNRNIATTIVLLIGATIAYFVGALLCLIGLLVAFPVILIAYAYMYRTFNGEPIAP